MLDIDDSATWKDSTSSHLRKELGHGPFKVIGNYFRGYRDIEYRVPSKKRRRIGKEIGTAMVPSRLLKKV